MAPSLRLIEVAHASHTGRVRNHNEDRALIRPPLLAVADGVGGANAGEVAAQLAVDAVADLGANATARRLRDRLIEANTQIRNVASDDPTRAGMGTTMTAALLGSGDVTVVHVGDSRAYLMRDGNLRQLTDDHSLVAEMLRQGQLTEAEAATHPSRNVITRALGAEPEVDVDEIHSDLRPGDRLLLCSDGLSSMVDHATIETAIASSADLQHAARTLLDAALDAGGMDNVTLVLGRFDMADATGSLPVVGPPVGTDATEKLRIPPPPPASPKASRTARVLEPTRRIRDPRLRRTAAIGGVLVALLVGFGAWVGSRVYFVDADESTTVRVYHGPPFSLLGNRLFASWADTGIDAQAVRAADPSALGRNARGQGDAVRQAVEIIWTHGLPTVPAIEVPAPPTPTTKVPPGQPATPTP